MIAAAKEYLYEGPKSKASDAMKAPDAHIDLTGDTSSREGSPFDSLGADDMTDLAMDESPPKKRIRFDDDVKILPLNSTSIEKFPKTTSFVKSFKGNPTKVLVNKEQLARLDVQEMWHTVLPFDIDEIHQKPDKHATRSQNNVRTFTKQGAREVIKYCQAFIQATEAFPHADFHRPDPTKRTVFFHEIKWDARAQLLLRLLGAFDAKDESKKSPTDDDRYKSLCSARFEDDSKTGDFVVHRAKVLQLLNLRVAAFKNLYSE